MGSLYNCYSNELNNGINIASLLPTEKKTSVGGFQKLTDKDLFIQLDSLKGTGLKTLGEQADGRR